MRMRGSKQEELLEVHWKRKREKLTDLVLLLITEESRRELILKALPLQKAPLKATAQQQT